MGVAGEGHGVTPSSSMEANSGVRGRGRAAGKAPEWDDRQTDRQTYTQSIHYMMIMIRASLIFMATVKI